MSVTPKLLADLEAAGERVKAAERERKAASAALAQVVRRGVRQDMPKADIARAARVSRQTVHLALRP